MAADVHVSHPTMPCVEHIDTTVSVASLVVGAYGTGGLFLHCGTSDPAWHTLLYVEQPRMAGISSQMVASSVNGSQYTLDGDEWDVSDVSDVWDGSDDALHAVRSEHPTMLGMAVHSASRSASTAASGSVKEAHAMDVGSVTQASVPVSAFVSVSGVVGACAVDVPTSRERKRERETRTRRTSRGFAAVPVQFVRAMVVLGGLHAFPAVDRILVRESRGVMGANAAIGTERGGYQFGAASEKRLVLNQSRVSEMDALITTTAR